MNPQPKPSPKPARKAHSLARTRQRERAMRKLRDAVWARDRSRCRRCGILLIRGGLFWTGVGHVHHLRGRNVAPQDKFNPDACVLLCAGCHWKAHEKTVVD